MRIGMIPQFESGSQPQAQQFDLMVVDSCVKVEFLFVDKANRGNIMGGYCLNKCRGYLPPGFTIPESFRIDGQIIDSNDHLPLFVPVACIRCTHINKQKYNQGYKKNETFLEVPEPFFKKVPTRRRQAVR